MASQDAINALYGSTKEWNEYNSNRSDRLDLTLADLKNTDLRGKEFMNCDFSGADLENVNFDNCHFSNSDFSNTYFENTSFVNVQIIDCIFENSNINNTIIRDSSILKSKFNKTTFDKTIFKNIKLTSCSMSCLIIVALNFEDVKVKCSEIDSLNSNNFELLDSEFIQSTISNSNFSNGIFNNILFDLVSFKATSFHNSQLIDFSIINSSIKKMKIDNCKKVVQLDFSNTKIYDVDLHNFDLPNSVFFDTVFINCIWPIQKGVTNILGVHALSLFLLGHPVQDVKGISPILRREIADAQFIKEKLNCPKHMIRIWFYIWGATTNFGQSVFRLTILTLLLLLMLNIAYTTDCSFNNFFEYSFSSYFNSFKELVYTFFGIDYTKQIEQNSLIQEKILVLDRFFGFFILGLWIGLSANKIGKLSSE